jgi:hypothetical protein
MEMRPVGDTLRRRIQVGNYVDAWLHPVPGRKDYGDLILKGSVWRSASFLGPDKMVKKDGINQR